MFWGVTGLKSPKHYKDTDSMIFSGINRAHKTGLIERDDHVVLVAGTLLGLPYTTNLIQYIEVQDIISSEESLQKFSQSYSLDTKEDNY